MASNFSSRKYSSVNQESLTLERVLGLSTLSNTSLVSTMLGELFYAAGCISVKFSTKTRKQTNFFQSSNRTISCQTLSPDGRFLAIGERGSQPTITIWDIFTQEKIVSLSGHKHGVGCLAFSPCGRYLVSTGFKHDKQLYFWDWQQSKVISICKLSNKVHGIDFHHTGDFFVTCGERHMKWWHLIRDSTGVTEVQGKPAGILEDHKNAVFMGVVCGTGIFDSQVYSITSTGVLCSFLASSRLMDRTVQVQAHTAFCLSLTVPPAQSSSSQSFLAVGCSEGLICTFSPTDLLYLSTFPLPAPLSQSDLTSSFPACYALSYLPPSATSPPQLAAVYSDRSLFIWEFSDFLKPSVSHSSLSHHGCVWDVLFLEPKDPPATQPLPVNTFVTCSSDGSVRFWNLDCESQQHSMWRNLYSQDMLHMLEIEQPLSLDDQADSPSKHHLQASTSNFTGVIEGLRSGPFDLSRDLPDLELPEKQHATTAPRSLALHPNGNELAVGSRDGRLRVFSLSSMTCKVDIQAHASDVLALSYSPPLARTASGPWALHVEEDEEEESDLNHTLDSPTPLVLLASSGRDRLIHIYDASPQTPSPYSLIRTLDHHSSSVTSVRFTSDGQRLLSAGGDRTLVLCSVQGPEISRMKALPTPHGTINGLVVEPTNRFAVSSGQNGRLNIWGVQAGRHVRAYRSEAINGELYKCDIDPSGMFIATCSFDKTLSLFDFFSGELVSQVNGHSELVTGLRFSPDGRFLVSVGGDGCVLVWRVGEGLVSAMRERLMELYSSAQIKMKKQKLNSSHSSSSLPLPSPSPSPSRQKRAKALTSGPPKSINNPLPIPPTQASRENKWAQRATASGTESSSSQEGEEKGYDLFGQRISLEREDPTKRKMMTLELTATQPLPPLPPSPSRHSSASTSLSQSTRAQEREEGDEVVCGGLSDEDLDDDDDDEEEEEEGDLVEDRLFTGGRRLEDDSEGSEKAEASVGQVLVEGEGEEGRVFAQISALDASAQKLEAWLEELIRKESTLDENVSSSSPPIPVLSSQPSPQPSLSPSEPHINRERGEGRVDLNQSLSSDFFRRLNHPTPSPSPFSTPSRQSPPPSSSSQVSQSREEGIDVMGVGIDLLGSGAGRIETKRRETAAAVASMRERLRGMGLLGATIQTPSKPLTSSSSSSSSSSLISSSMDSISPLPLPPPPSLPLPSLPPETSPTLPPAPPTPSSFPLMLSLEALQTRPSPSGPSEVKKAKIEKEEGMGKEKDTRENSPSSQPEGEVEGEGEDEAVLACQNALSDLRRAQQAVEDAVKGLVRRGIESQSSQALDMSQLTASLSSPFSLTSTSLSPRSSTVLAQAGQDLLSLSLVSSRLSSLCAASLQQQPQTPTPPPPYTSSLLPPPPPTPSPFDLSSTSSSFLSVPSADSLPLPLFLDRYSDHLASLVSLKLSLRFPTPSSTPSSAPSSSIPPSQYSNQSQQS